MNIPKFEDQIKNVFEQYRPETDTDVLWENIEPHLKKKKKRRFVLFFWGVLSLAVLLFFARGAGLKPSLPSPAAAAASQPAKATADNKNLPGRSTDAGFIRHPDASVPAKRAQVSFMNKAPITASASPIDPTDITAKPMIFPPVAGTATNNNAAPTRSVTATDLPVPALNSVNTQGDAAALQFAALEFALPPTFGEWKIANQDSISPQPSVLGQPVPSAKNPVIATEPKKEAKVAANTPKDKKKSDPRKKSKRRKPRWEQNLSFQAGPAFAFKQLTRRNGMVVPVGHLDKRKSSEQSLESFTIGMFYAATTRKGLVLKTGLDYRQSNERFHVDYRTRETKEVNGVVSILVDGSGNTIEQITGPKEVTTTTVYSNTAYNHYYYINLPIGVGYRHTGKKSRWELSGGIDFNLFFRAQGTLYNLNNFPAKIKVNTTTYDNLFRTNTGTDVWASYSYDWRLSDKLRWQVSANVQVPLRPISSPEYAVVQRYFNVGAQVGVVYLVGR